MKKGKELIVLAEKSLKEGNVKMAIQHLELLLEDANYEEVASNKLASIYLKNNNYDLARKALSKNRNKEDITYKKQSRNLEFLEMNYQTALKYNDECMKAKDKYEQKKSIYMLADIQRNLGERKIAQHLYELLLDDSYKNYAWSSFISLCSLDLEIGDYQQLEKRLIQVNYKTLSLTSKESYKFLWSLHNFYRYNQVEQNMKYSYNRLIRNHCEELLDHLEKHRESAFQEEKGYFLKYINLEKLISLATEQITVTNPTILVTGFNYVILTDSIIGIQNGKTTNAFQATTLFGLPNIITMYPVTVSEEFNREGFRENQQVLEKRLERGNLK